MHPHTKISFINDEIGIGVTATQFIPKGTITWVQDDLDGVYTADEIENMNPVLQELMDKFSFRNNQGEFILCWDLSKYVNHSFKSNCLSTAYNFEIAIRDIQIGEELTDDYGYLNVLQPFKAANEGTDREVVYPDDVLNNYKKWDKALETVFPHIFKINQPMLNLISEEMKEEIKKVANGEKEMTSTRSLYFDPEKARI